MRIIKKITALSTAMAILTVSLTGCGSFDTEDMPDTPEVTEDMAESELPEITGKVMPDPETYEDYMKLAAESYDRQDWETALAFYQGAKELDDGKEEVYRGMSDVYLQVDDIVQALAILDEGIEKRSFDSFSQSLLSQRKEYVLAGMVAIRTKLAEKEFDDDGNDHSGRLSEYDGNGNEIKSIYYGAKEKISNVREYQYDGDGNRTEYKYMSYDSHGSIDLFSHETLAYDENGNETEYVSYGESGTVIKKTESEYDSNGNRIKHIEYKGKDEIEEWTETTYDAFGNGIKIEVYDESGTCIRTVVNNYDEHGNQTEHIIYGNHENIIGKEEYEYDKDGNEVRYTQYDDGVTASYWYEKEYDENGNEIKRISYHYHDEVTMGYWYEQAYDENGNMTKYDHTEYVGKEAQNPRWEREYDEDGRKAAFCFYDNEKTASYQSMTEYDENGLIIKYTGCDRNGDILIGKETEYDEAGKVIKESYYDAGGNLIRYYENEYDDFGSITRQAMYEDDILKYEKQMSYVYRYIGNIDAEAADYMYHDMTTEEYNLRQRDTFTQFLEGQEKAGYCSDFNSIGEGQIVRDSITNLIDFAYYREHKESLEYTFMDMTGDGIEELIINCGGNNLYIIQSDHGILKVICRSVGGNLGTYLVKYNGRTGVCCNFGGHVGSNEEIYYFYDGKGKKEISLSDYQHFQEDGTESRCYSISDNDSFEWRDISMGEYYDVSGTIIIIAVDWYPLEEPVF